jgi:hypothetical protein
MSRARVYVETTIPNFFYETRNAPEMVLRREATRSWWATAPQRYNLLTSSTVFLELERFAHHSRVPDGGFCFYDVERCWMTIPLREGAPCLDRTRWISESA